MTKKMLTTMDIDVNDNQYGERFYIFKCPKCKKELRFASWEKNICNCGYVWKVRFIAIGEKEYANKSS